MHRSVLLCYLTQKESVVLNEILNGKANKCIANDLILSQRTIEAHRSNAFHKMRVRNALELSQQLRALKPTTSYYRGKLSQGRQVGPVWFFSSEIRSSSA